MRLHAERPGLQILPDPGPEADTRPSGPSIVAVASDRGTAPISPDHPSLDRLEVSRPAPHIALAAVPAGTGDSGGTTIRRISASAWSGSSTVAEPGATPIHRPTPYESGLAAVARHDVHIERVWPMRSPSTGTLEESSSAYFQRERRGTPPAGILPVGGLRMSQDFSHEPVMRAEVVDLFRPVPPGLILDTTLGGGGHAAALLTAHPGLRVLGIDRDPAAIAAATTTLAPFSDRAVIRRSRFDALGDVVRDVAGSRGRARRRAGAQRGPVRSPGSARLNSTMPNAGSPTVGTQPSICGWIRPRA